MDPIYGVEPINHRRGKSGAFGAPVLDMVLGAGDSGYAGHLDKGRDETGRMLLNLQQRLQQRFRPHDAPQAPSGHGIGFSEGVTGQCSLPHTRQSCQSMVLIGAVNEIFVGLVADHQEVVLRSQSGHGFQFRQRVDPPRRVVRIVDNHRFGPGRNVSAQALVGYGVFLFLAQRDRHRYALGKLDLLAKANPSRLDQQDLITLADEGIDGIVEALFAAGCHQDIAARVNVQAVVPGQFFRHRFTEFRKPPWRLDIRHSIAQGLYPSLYDVLRCDVMWAGLPQVYDVSPLPGQLPSPLSGGDRGRRLYLIES